MPLPPAAPRRPAHLRSITLQGYSRQDGLWDIEGRLVDSKPFDHRDFHERVIEAGSAVHDISIRLTLDDRRQVVAIAGSTDSVPFSTCPRATDSLQGLVGATIEAGWRRAIRERLPMHASCTHMRELLLVMGTAAFQSMSFGHHIEGTPGSEQRPSRAGGAPFYIDQCISWQRDGPIVAEVFPGLSTRDPQAGA